MGERSKESTFAWRLAIACDNSDRVPPHNYGRQSYIATELKQQFNVRASKETVRKWFAGETLPRPEKMRALARLLRVDEPWLILGTRPDAGPAKQNARSASAAGPVNLVIGLLAMSGANCAFPEKNDPRAANIHFYTIIAGRQHGIHVSLGQKTRDGLKFTASNDLEHTISIGVVERTPVQFELYQLTSAALSKFGKRRGGYIELTGSYLDGVIQVKSESLRRIERLEELNSEPQSFDGIFDGT